MKAAIFVPDANSPGKVDMMGAFLPEARAFARFHRLPAGAIRTFPAAGPMDQRRAVCSLALRAIDDPVDVVAWFCHGWRDGIQAGYRLSDLPQLATILALATAPAAHVLLYCCDTARDGDPEVGDDVQPGPGGDGGFADRLRDELEARGRQVTVMAHASTGHCGTNPYARRFAPGQGGRGGEWYVEPDGPLWRAWSRSMRDVRSTLRYRFWAMTPGELADELGPRVA